ncbi:MAG: class I SAM-dependent methyltransferase [Candidatus Limivicinus sp.]
MQDQNFSAVQDTLFIPLAARVAVSRRFPEYFYDGTALKFQNLEQVRAITAKSSEYSFIASAARYCNMDRFTASFLNRYPAGNVVNLGAGLETMNYRLDRPEAHFYSLDFPEVISLRERILGTAENETQIGCDITGLSWTEELNPEEPVMFIASGVFQYFKPETVSKLLRGLKSIFKNAEIVFDATNEVGIRYARRYVKKSGNKEAMMYFYINDGEKFAEENGLELLELRGFYDEARRMIGKKLGIYTRVAMKVADDKKRTLLLHLKLN